MKRSTKPPMTLKRATKEISAILEKHLSQYQPAERLRRLRTSLDRLAAVHAKTPAK